MPEAARINDPVEHTAAMAALLAGAVGGAVIGAAIVLTGGAAAPAIAAVAVAACAGASMGGGLGELLGSLGSFETGPITNPCAKGVYINLRKAARSAGSEINEGDFVECGGQPFLPGSAHPHSMIAEGSATVFIEGLPAARRGDRLNCGSKIAEGSATVFIGGGQQVYAEIESEVPWLAEAALVALGLAGGVGAIALAGRGLRVIYACRFAGGLAGGWAGGTAGHYLGGRYYGEGSRGQKLLGFGGGFLGGSLGAGIAGSRPIYEPMQRWAARNNFPGQQHWFNCGPQSCQQIIRSATGRNISEVEMEQIGVQSRAYTPQEGTIHKGMAEILKTGGVPAHSEPGSPQNIQRALEQRKGVVTGHDAGVFWGDERYKGRGHAVQTTGVVKDGDGNVTHYIVNDTGSGKAGRMVPADQYEGSLKRDSIAVTDNPIW
ncbi:MAG TPA: PAAR domain-containing protein [Blastocatellia bacterium]|nr:PAAR domain-containing protein [Blastocatellia bacterium]